MIVFIRSFETSFVSKWSFQAISFIFSNVLEKCVFLISEKVINDNLSWSFAIPKIGSAACPGLSNESMPCGGGACEEFEWTSFRYTECSKTCGGGQTTATRSCKVKGTNREVDSRSCDGARTAVYACNTQRCNSNSRVEYEWDSYRYSACDASCGGGKQWGMRRCVMKGTNRAVDNKFCGENNTLRRDCNTHPCQNYRNAPKPNLKASREQCGVKPGYGSKSPVQLRIAGGTIADDGEWPWQVSLQHRSCKKSNHFGSNCNWKHMCGASIVPGRTKKNDLSKQPFFFCQKVDFLLVIEVLSK